MQTEGKTFCVVAQFQNNVIARPALAGRGNLKSRLCCKVQNVRSRRRAKALLVMTFLKIISIGMLDK
jgi:hypothetical protein